jgi:hypothetical protein
VRNFFARNEKFFVSFVTQEPILSAGGEKMSVKKAASDAPFHARAAAKPSTLDDIPFPDEAALAQALQAQTSQKRHLEEQVSLAARTAVDQWLRSQNGHPAAPLDACGK